jgi:hypothetical protein
MRARKERAREREKERDGSEKEEGREGGVLRELETVCHHGQCEPSRARPPVELE